MAHPRCMFPVLRCLRLPKSHQQLFKDQSAQALSPPTLRSRPGAFVAASGSYCTDIGMESQYRNRYVKNIFLQLGFALSAGAKKPRRAGLVLGAAGRLSWPLVPGAPASLVASQLGAHPDSPALDHGLGLPVNHDVWVLVFVRVVGHGVPHIVDLLEPLHEHVAIP